MLGALLATCVLAGCGTPPAKDFGGPWKPVNRYQTAPAAIPLNQAYVFFATPMDGTLKSMLARWAKDAGMTLSYRLPYDYTLYTPVSGIHTTDIKAAAAQLDAIYSSEQLHVATGNGQIVVEHVDGTMPPTASSKSARNTGSR
jgi:hypothetical protein